MAKNRRFQNPSTKPEPKPEVIEAKEVKETVLEETPKVEFQDPEEVEVDAIVDGVQMSLNIRMLPIVEPNNQIAIVGKGAKLKVVNPNKTYDGSGEKWYKVKTSKDSQIGYAMKKYIKLI